MATSKTMATTKTKPSLDLFELLVDEAVEICQRMERLRSKLGRVKTGSEAYFELMSEIGVTAGEMNIKTQSLMRERDAIIDALPEDD
jgi:hypothetical protein